MLVLSGEPGIGKTALLRGAVDLAESVNAVTATGLARRVAHTGNAQRPAGRPLARTLLCYGERLRRAARKTEAPERLREAYELFERLEAQPWARRARRELRVTGERLRRREDAGDELTPQELQVALEVSEGKTNKEAGVALFLSPKTLEFHLARVFGKLDVSSCAEVIRRFAASEPVSV